MPPFGKRYRRFRKMRNSSLSGSSIFEIQELMVGTSNAPVPTSEFQPDGLQLVPTQSTSLPRFNMSLPDNGSIHNEATNSLRVNSDFLSITFACGKWNFLEDRLSRARCVDSVAC